ncbi:MAG: ABC transporter permease [Nostoc sp.]|uniref:ABC transporter permease n=1 Tax=Nostoc sp. TaxID=1180 RepID=UPI002FEED8B1
MNRQVRQIAVQLGFLALWEWVTRVGIIDPFFVSSPSQVVLTLISLFSGREIWSHIFTSFTEALLGLVSGFFVGAILGFVAALTPTIAEQLNPFMTLLNATPRVILAPLFVVWFGIGIESKIVLSFSLVVVLMFFAVYNGVKDVDTRLIERVKTLGGDRRVLLQEVYIPSITAWVMGNLKIALGFAFTGAVVGEFVASKGGLGYLLSFAQTTYNASLMVAIILLIQIFVLLLTTFAEKLERRLLSWKYRTQPSPRTKLPTAVRTAEITS